MRQFIGRQEMMSKAQGACEFFLGFAVIRIYSRSSFHMFWLSRSKQKWYDYMEMNRITLFWYMEAPELLVH